MICQEFESLAEMFKEDPPLAPVLIDGSRRGHKMLIAGPFKAGKSFALMEMTISIIAEGIPWFGFNCEMGKVLYLNMELDRPPSI